MPKHRFDGLTCSLLMMTVAAGVIIGCGGSGATGGTSTGTTTTTTGGTTGGTTGALEPIEFVFSSDMSGTRNLYIAKDDGTDVRQVTDDPGSEFNPAWNAATDLIAFRRAGVIYTIRPDGTDEQARTSTAFADQPSFSPDGSVIAFAAESGIYLHDLATGLDTVIFPVTEADEFVYFPTYSRDGTKIYFIRRPPGGAEHLLLRMNPDGSGLETIYSDPLNMARPFESRDGTKLYVSRGPLLMMDLDGTNVETVTPRNAFSGSFPIDGSRIIYDSGAPPSWNIYRTLADGSEEEIVFEGPNGDVQPMYPQ